MLTGDQRALVQIVAAPHFGMTTDEFDAEVRRWLASARHPHTNRPIITAPAVYLDGDDVLVAFQGRSIMRCLPDTYRAGLVVLRVVAWQQAQMRVAWCASLNGGGAPIITTTGRVANPIVWIVGAEGDNRLHGFRGDTGQPIFDGGGSTDGMTNLCHLATLLAAGGHLYVAGDGRVHAFSFAP
jgi:hypothetical protein